MDQSVDRRKRRTQTRFRMNHSPLFVGAVAASLLAVSSAPAQPTSDKYPSPAQMKSVRTATLYLQADGAFAHLDEVEWCEEVESYLRERGHKDVRQHHQQVVNEVAVGLPTATYRAVAQEIVRLMSTAAAPLSRFKARFAVRHYDNTLVTARFEGEQWTEAHESRPDPIVFTRALTPGQWMMSVEQSASSHEAPRAHRTKATRILLWDKIGEANPYDVQALVSMPDGTLHRSTITPWNPAGVEVMFPADFPTLKGKKLPPGAYRVIFEADGLTIDWPRSLPFER